MKRDILSWIRRKPKKLSIAKQEHVIELFHNLYSSGFHLSEVIDFLRRSKLVEDNFVERMQVGLANGKPLSAILSDLGFSDQVTTQLALAEQHGNVTLSLEKIRSYLENLAQVRKKLVEVATYPVLLLGFLILIMAEKLSLASVGESKWGDTTDQCLSPVCFVRECVADDWSFDAPFPRPSCQAACPGFMFG